MALLPDRIGSKWSFSPSAIFSRVIRLSAGMGGGPSGASPSGRGLSWASAGAASATSASAVSVERCVMVIPSILHIAPVLDQRVVVVVFAPDIGVGVKVIARQALKKGHEVGLLARHQAQRPEPRVLERIVTAARIVEIHHLFERGKGAVMHVGGGIGQLAQGGREKAALCLGAMRADIGPHVLAQVHVVLDPHELGICDKGGMPRGIGPDIGIVRHAGIVWLVIGESRAAVTGGALPLALED